MNFSNQNGRLQERKNLHLDGATSEERDTSSKQLSSGYRFVLKYHNLVYVGKGIFKWREHMLKYVHKGASVV